MPLTGGKQPPRAFASSESAACGLNQEAMTVTVMASLISALSAFARVPHLRDYQAATAVGLLARIAADRGATFT